MKILNDPTQDAKLKAFIDYCKAHPDERFWQAVRNTSEYNFIYGSKYEKYSIPSDDTVGELKDTFYL